MSTKSAVSYYKVVTLPDSAAGGEFTLTPPGGEAWRIISLAFLFVTSAAVANRRVAFVGDDQSNNYLRAPASIDQAASLSVRYGAYAGAQGGGDTGSGITIPLPSEAWVLLPGHRLRSITTNHDVGDQYTNINALVQVFPQGPALEWLPTVATQIEDMG